MVVSTPWPLFKGILLFLILSAIAGCMHFRFEKAEDTERGVPARLYLTGQDIDMGEAVSGEAVRKDIRLRNIGGSPLRITRTEASCGCTVVDLDQNVIPPGGMAIMGLLVDTTGKMGPVEKTVTLFSNDVLEPEITLRLRVRVTSPAHKEIEVESGSIFRGTCRKCHVEPGMGLSGERLFDASCSMCHRSKDDAYSPGPPEEVLRTFAADILEKGIQEGVPGTSMPGFGKSAGGPLDEAQVQSLVNFIREGQ